MGSAAFQEGVWPSICEPLKSWPLEHHRVRLNLPEDLGRYERAHLHHRGRWANIPEEFSMRLPDLFPLRDVRDIHPRAHNILHTRPGLLQCALNVLQCLYRLRIDVV